MCAVVLKHALAMGEFPIAGNAAFLDNYRMTSTNMKPRSFAQRCEYLVISLGMSALALLLEKMVLRSVKSDGAKS